MLAIGHDLSRLVLIGVAVSFTPVGATLLAAGIVAEHGQMFKGGLTLLIIAAVAATGWLITAAVNVGAAYDAGFTVGYDEGREAGQKATRPRVVPLHRVQHRNHPDGF